MFKEALLLAQIELKCLDSVDIIAQNSAPSTRQGIYSEVYSSISVIFSFCPLRYGILSHGCYKHITIIF